jgi:AdoMet-dependent heme synthase
MRQYTLAAPSTPPPIAARRDPRRLPRTASSDDAVPRVVVWQVTRGCDLGCAPCPLESAPRRSPHELTTGEALEVVEDLRRLGVRRLVLTGGDPLRRDDIEELVAAAARAEMFVELSAAASPRTTPAVVRALARAGLARLTLAMDGSTAALHDRFRRMPGEFRSMLRLLRTARDAGLRTRVNSRIGWHNAHDLDALAALLGRLAIEDWSVFFLLPTGAKRPEELTGADEFEAFLERLAGLAREAPFTVSTRSAPQFRRVIAQRRGGERGSRLTAGLTRHAGRPAVVEDARDGLFIDYRGEIQPSRHLPLSAGNVLTHDLTEVYRLSPLLRTLRESAKLKGKCGACEYRELCGGSRARALLLTGDPLEADPYCAYLPAPYARQVIRGEAEEPRRYFARRIRGWPRAPRGPRNDESESLWEFVNRTGRTVVG